LNIRREHFSLLMSIIIALWYTEEESRGEQWQWQWCRDLDQ